jgi:hypothetical protein
MMGPRKVVVVRAKIVWPDERNGVHRRGYEGQQCPLDLVTPGSHRLVRGQNHS